MGARDSGFSLIELVVVLAIAGVLLGASVVGLNMSRTPRMLELAAGQVAADLRAAQQRARLERAEYVVEFDAASNTYRILRVGATSEQRIRLPRGVMLVSTTWPSNRLTLSTFGNPDRTGAVRVRNRSGERDVLVDPLGHITTSAP